MERATVRRGICDAAAAVRRALRTKAARREDDDNNDNDDDDITAPHSVWVWRVPLTHIRSASSMMCRQSITRPWLFITSLKHHTLLRCQRNALLAVWQQTATLHAHGPDRYTQCVCVCVRVCVRARVYCAVLCCAELCVLCVWCAVGIRTSACRVGMRMVPAVECPTGTLRCAVATGRGAWPHWISDMIVARAASMPRTCSVSMMWLEVVCVPTIPSCVITCAPRARRGATRRNTAQRARNRSGVCRNNARTGLCQKHSTAGGGCNSHVDGATQHERVTNMMGHYKAAGRIIAHYWRIIAHLE